MCHFHESLIIAVFLSFIIHLAFLCGIVGWDLYHVLPGSGGTAVEVSFIEEGSGSDFVVKKNQLKADHEGDIAKGTDNSEDGNAGGRGSNGEGPGDPRLAAIWKKINKAKYYPETARGEGLEGSPKVTFSIGLSGKVTNIEVTTSSGNKLLDEAAVETVKRSSPLPFYPQPITIAVRYSLK